MSDDIDPAELELARYFLWSAGRSTSEAASIIEASIRAVAGADTPVEDGQGET